MSVQKIQLIGPLASRIARLKEEGRRVVFTNGCFDLLHSGHIELLEAARSHGDVLVVGINSDDSVKRLKGEDRPILSEKERARILAALEAVSFVCVFAEDTPLETIRALRPNVLVKGADWKDKGIVGSEEVEEWGGETVVVRLVEGRSTTAIVDRIRTPDRSG